jgi:hypothetical protein
MEHVTLENLLESLEHMRANDRIQVDIDVGKSPDTDDVRKKSYVIIKKQLEGMPVFIITCDGEYEAVRTEADVDSFIKGDIKRGSKPGYEERQKNDASWIIRELLGAGGSAWGTLEDNVVDYLLTTYIRNFSDFGEDVLVTVRAIRGVHGVHPDTTSEMVGTAIQNLMNEEILLLARKERGGYTVKWHPLFQVQIKKIRDKRFGIDKAGV